MHRDCVHDAEEESHVEHGPCPHAPYFERPTVNGTAAGINEPRYYSDWAVYAQYTDSGGFSFMSSDWTVPKAPTSTGPVPGMSSAYLFNGLEDSGGKAGTAQFILQPVLSYGKSGCIVNPANFFHWSLTSFHVTAAGRAYCGARLTVEEGEQLRGIMRADGDAWTIESTRLGRNETSRHTVSLAGKRAADTAYVTLETMVNYGCDAFPASGSTTFTNIVLRDAQGEHVRPTWLPMVEHTECNQGVDVLGEDVTLRWDASRSAARASSDIVI